MLDSFPHRLAHVCVVLLLGVSGLRAGGTGPYPAYAAVPAADLWMYPNASSPGTRGSASTFTYLPFTGQDDRMAQFVIKFNTVAAGIPAGLGADNYDVHSLTLTSVYCGDSLPYDPTEDPRASLGSSPSIADPDAGRPLELHGTGFRGGFSAATFLETSSYGNRNAFASSFDPAGVARDVTNSVTFGFDSYPWAIGKVLAPVDIDADPVVYVPLAAGQAIPLYSHVVFDINLNIPGVANYVRQSLNQGFIWLTLSSFHSATQMGSTGFPSYFTKENPEQELFGDVASTLNASYSLPLRISAVTRNQVAGTASVTWNGSPGFKYVVEKNDDLATSGWIPVGTLTTATAAPLNWTGNNAAARSFFRVARTPQP